MEGEHGGTQKPDSGSLSQRDVALDCHTIIVMHFARQERAQWWKREKNHMYAGIKINVVMIGGLACVLTGENVTILTCFWQRLYLFPEKLGGVCFCLLLSSETNIYWMFISQHYMTIYLWSQEIKCKTTLQGKSCYLYLQDKETSWEWVRISLRSVWP